MQSEQQAVGQQRRRGPRGEHARALPGPDGLLGDVPGDLDGRRVLSKLGLPHRTQAVVTAYEAELMVPHSGGYHAHE